MASFITNEFESVYLSRTGEVFDKYCCVSTAYVLLKLENSEDKVSSFEELCEIEQLDEEIAEYLKDVLQIDKVFDKIKELANGYIYNRFEKSLKALVLFEYFEKHYKDETDVFNIIHTVADSILDIKDYEKVADFSSNLGVFLRESWLNNKQSDSYGFYQKDPEENRKITVFAKMRFDIIGMNFNLEYFDILEDKLSDMVFDKIYVNVPLFRFIYLRHLKKRLKDKEKENIDYIIIEKLLKCLKTLGKLVAVVPSRDLNGKGYSEFRKRLIENGMVESVVFAEEYIPTNKIKEFNISSCHLLVLSNYNEKVKMVNASSFFNIKKRRELINSVQKTISLYNDETDSLRVTHVSNDEIRRNDYSLLPTSYSFIDDSKQQNEYISLEDISTIKRGVPNTYLKEKWGLVSKKIDTQTGFSFENPSTPSFKYLNLVDIQDGIIDYDNLEELEFATGYDSSMDLSKLRKYVLSRNSIVVSRGGASNKKAIADLGTESASIIASDNIFVIDIKEGWDPWYVMAYLDSDDSIIEDKSYTGSYTIISVERLKSIMIPNLSMSKQAIIGKQYRNAIREISLFKKLLNDKLSDAKRVFNSASEKKTEIDIQNPQDYVPISRLRPAALEVKVAKEVKFVGDKESAIKLKKKK